MKETKKSRRELLLTSLKLGGVATAVSMTAPTINAIAQACGEATPKQTEGPYYPVKDKNDEDWDLTKVNGKKDTAKGTILWLKGTVVEAGSCNPIPGAMVEIWQTDVNGRYDHPKDKGKGKPLDPNFQYWGEAVCNDKGEYKFKTLKPGLYPGRARHIHFKVHLRGYYELTSQLYFKGEPGNQKDGIYKNLGKKGQDAVTVDFKNQDGELHGKFQIRMNAVADYVDEILD